MIALYGVTRTDSAPRLDDLHLIWSDDRDLVLIAGPDPGDVNRAGALAFGRTVERVAASADLLPFRYGTTVQDAGAARRLLLERATTWRRRLTAIRGCSELAVRVEPREAPPEAGSRSGAAHLNGLVSRSRRLDAAERDLSVAVADRCRDLRRLPGHERLRLSCLVERADAPHAHEAVSAWADTQPDLHVSVTGPWAPYSFAIGG